MTSSRPAVALIAIAGLFACTAPEEEPSLSPELAAARAVVAEWVDGEMIPGAVLVVSRGGETVLREAFGHAATHGFGAGQYPDGEGIRPLDTPLLMTAETVFDLASVTKVAATTLAVMTLVDRGLVELDAPAAQYLPELGHGDHATITVEHLLTHRSGLPQWLPTYYHADGPAAAIEYAATRPLMWPVGEERHYSDLGFMLLGALVEAVSGSTLDSFVEVELYRPLGLAKTSFRPLAGPFAATSHGNPFERRMVHDPDFGYRIDGDPKAWAGWRYYTLYGEVNDGNAHHAFRGVAGHAGLFSNADELTTLMQLVMRGGAIGGGRYASEEVVDRFLAPVVEGQALGWQLPEYAPAGSFGHTGFTGTFVLAVPDQSLTVVLLTNRQNIGVDAETNYPDVGVLQRTVTRLLTMDGGPEASPGNP